MYNGETGIMTIETSSESEKYSADLCINEALRDLSTALNAVEVNYTEAIKNLYSAAVKGIVAISIHNGLHGTPVEVCSLTSDKLFDDTSILGEINKIALITNDEVRSSWDSVVALRTLAREGGVDNVDVKFRIGAVENILSEARSQILYSTIKTHMKELRSDLRTEIERFKGDVEETLKSLSSEVKGSISKLNRKVSIVTWILWPITIVVIVVTIILTRLFLH